MKKNKILAFVLSLCLTVGLIPTLTANAEVRKDTKVKVEAKNGTTTNLDLGKFNPTPIPEDALKESKGARTKIAKAALKAAASTLRSSALKYTLNGLKYLGFSTATVNNITKYSYEIADVLDELSTWTNVVRQTVSDQVLTAMTNIGVSPTTANDIAWWVAYLIDLGLL